MSDSPSPAPQPRKDAESAGPEGRHLPSDRLAVLLARACARNRCRNITVLDLRKLSPVTDFFVLATGTSAVQMRSAVHRVAEEARDAGEKPLGIEGDDAGWWALLDFFDVVVHVFSEEARTYYDLELLWGDAPRIDWQAGWEPRRPDA